MNDEIKKTIERLIAEEDSNVERARLLVLLQISNLITDINARQVELEDKIVHADQYIQQNRRASDRFAGAKKVVITLAVAVQATTGYFLMELLDTPNKFKQELVVIDRRLAVIEAQLKSHAPIP
ncbi:MAG: hypothetical protein PHI64_08250 [Zoogloea sp.]|uniref:hypothetical protein n=1 Tax=Zoogloea sp. TaxID=49181 RepID=UPI002624460F|nr:hypothetical protein [Zoogloea sp.]MDD2988938.1 hypothetical protein [Zoogloea sp.]